MVHVSAATDPNQVGPGLAGFLAVFALAVASWLLFRSMNRHLRNVRYRGDAGADRDGAAGAGPGDAPRDRRPGDGGPVHGDGRQDDGGQDDGGGPRGGRAGPPPR